MVHEIITTVHPHGWHVLGQTGQKRWTGTRLHHKRMRSLGSVIIVVHGAHHHPAGFCLIERVENGSSVIRPHTEMGVVQRNVQRLLRTLDEQQQLVDEHIGALSAVM